MKKKSLLLLTLFALMMPGAMNAQNYITSIGSLDDWNAFCIIVNSGHNYSGETVNLTADVGPVSEMAGTETNPFCGTF